MSDNDQTRLERTLTGLSWWSGPTPDTWKTALDRADAEPEASWLTRTLRSPWPWVAGPVAAMVVVAIGTASLSSSRAPSRRQAPGIMLQTEYEADDATVGAPRPATRVLNRSQARQLSYASPATASRVASPAELAARGSAQWLPNVGRHVVRKVSIDLEADDVRGVYFKIVQIVLSQADGEFVERSELHGSGPQTSAYVTLRVRGDRLSTTLGTLRGLADVLREQAQSTDVTAQVVDTEARLRNEQRVEQELLALMDKRKDAALEELLKVSEVLAQVRERIERLVAERQRVGRQVALATIVVSVRSKAAPAKKAVGLGEQLGAEMRDAWRGGLSFLIRTLAAFVSVLVGGLVWWVALCVAVWMGRRWYLRRLETHDAPEA